MHKIKLISILKSIIYINLILMPSLLWSSCNNIVSFDDIPKYSSDFTHFKYTNPNATTSGEFSQFVIGTYNTLNPYGVLGIIPKDYYMLFFDTLFFSPDDNMY